MKVKKGMYIRNEEGLILKINKENIHGYKSYIGGSKIVKCGYKPIEVIKEGDYVNGYKVDFVQDNWVVFNHNHPRQLNILAEDIKFIVTKEQYESMEYKVE